MGLDYAHGKRIDKARRARLAGRPHDPDDRPAVPLRPLGPNWRTAYPQEFPVTVTRLDDHRPVDPAVKVLASQLGVSPTTESMRRLAAVLDAQDDTAVDPADDPDTACWYRGVADLPARLADRITVHPHTGEWIWTGSTDRDGYGRMGPKAAHREVWEALIGPIPAGLVLDHREDWGCTSKKCCWPLHLLPVTHAVNVMREGTGAGAINAVKTHCGACGAEFDLINTYWAPNGHRDCRACIRGRVAAYKRRLRVRLAGMASTVSSTAASLTAPRTTPAP